MVVRRYPENAECVGKEQKKRHDNIAKTEHLELCQKIGLVGKAKWYNHTSARAVKKRKGQNIVGY